MADYTQDACLVGCTSCVSREQREINRLKLLRVKNIITGGSGFVGLKNTIDYYLENDEKRESIRRRGFERTKKDHTYLNRWQYIIKTIYEKT